MCKGALLFTVWQTYTNYAVSTSPSICQRSSASGRVQLHMPLHIKLILKEKKDAERWRMTYSFIWGVPRYLSSSFGAEGSLLSITCMRGYISSDMCFWNRELITCTLSKLGICWYYFSYPPYVTLRNENIKDAETNLTDKDDKRDTFFQFMRNAIYRTLG